MIGRVRGATLVALIASIVWPCPPASPVGTLGAQERPQSAFRSGAFAVTVDVTVRDRSRRSITGLTASDFQVFDNGVLQKVDDVSYGKLPIDVTVGLDVSYSVTGDILERLQRAVVQLMRDLEREDRLKLVLFNMRVSRTMDFTTDVKAVERAIRGATAGGGTALLDAVSVSLVSASAPDRRQLIVVFTDGRDSSSTSSPAVLTGIAQRTRGTLTFVVPSAAPTIGTMMSPVGRTVTAIRPVGGSAGPGALLGLMNVLAGETGGSVLPVVPGADLTATFRSVLSQFRSTYVLYYTPRGVDVPGYHSIEVKVSRAGAQVQARRGYFSS